MLALAPTINPNPEPQPYPVGDGRMRIYRSQTSSSRTLLVFMIARQAKRLIYMG